MLSQPVLINGKYFNSYNLAAKYLNVNDITIKNRVLSERFTEYQKTIYCAPKSKKCSICKENKISSEFKKSSVTRDGRSSWCKKCHSTINIQIVDRKLANKSNITYKKTLNGRVSNRLYKVKRRANMISTTVDLTNDQNKAITLIYKKAADLRDRGIDVHVDHKIPLSKGGKHIPNNLQILSAEENLKKSNKLDWDNDTEVQDQTFMDLAHFYIIT